MTTKEQQLTDEIERKRLKQREYDKNFRTNYPERKKEFNKNYNLSDKGKSTRKRIREKAKVEGRTKQWREKFKNNHPKYWSEKSKEYNKNNKLIYLSRKSANNTLRKDDNCLFCNINEDLHFHHLIYRVPCLQEDVITLCRQCHSKLHIFLDFNIELNKARQEARKETLIEVEEILNSHLNKDEDELLIFELKQQLSQLGDK